jgi:hypothetical protein
MNTIIRKGTPEFSEWTGTGTIKPGMLVEPTAGAATLGVHGTAGGTATAMFALEDDLQGKDITDDYATATRVRVGHFHKGQEVTCRIANGESATLHCKLESNGDGYMRVVDADTSAGTIGVQSVVLMALEAVDMSGSSGVDPDGFCRGLVM